MELKPYQRQVLNDLDTYLDHFRNTGSYTKAFEKINADAGAYAGLDQQRTRSYNDDVPGTPHVCIKVPTAGGKTFIACNAIDVIYRYYAEAETKLVIWLVPSRTILDQTLDNLSDAAHPYRQRINALFQHKVEVFDKDTMLQGAGFNAKIAESQLNICVLSFDSLRAKNKEDRKLYQENGQLLSFMNRDGNDHLLEGIDETAWINVIRRIRPVVIVDEAHGAKSVLSVEMLQALNPAFILDLTATPRGNSNIISEISAMELKKEHMVKLPLIVRNHKERPHVIESAINLQAKLEQEAKTERAKGGRYIRPIVLFQAQPKSMEDNTTFEKLKELLVSLGIPSGQIAIKTSKINELNGIDLMSEKCEIRYIITVNALKEGWDCPFAYILASLAHKSSSVDIEQIIGRVLRQPYVSVHSMELLNYSYVLTASERFLETLQTIVHGLNQAGFSESDYSVADADQTGTTAALNTVHQQLLQIDDSVEQLASEIKATQINASAEEIASTILAIETSAKQASREMDELLKEHFTGNGHRPSSNSDKGYAMRDHFREEGAAMRLPMFFLRHAGGFLLDEGEYTALNKESLLDGFDISQADGNISFEMQDHNIYKVDLEQTQRGESSFTFSKISLDRQRDLVRYFLSQPKETQKRELAGALAKQIRNLKAISEPSLKRYIERVISSFSSDQIEHAAYNNLYYSEIFKRKIQALCAAYAEKQFVHKTLSREIIAREIFSLTKRIYPNRLGAAITKSLYEREAWMNPFEERVIDTIANIDNVEFWHRNQEARGFMINGFINHYPDFIIRLRSGRIVVLETKGDHLEGDTTPAKIRMGRKWSELAGDKYEYFMLFEHKQVQGAVTLDQAVSAIRLL
jgi:type III restriction enzyme